MVAGDTTNSFDIEEIAKAGADIEDKKVEYDSLKHVTEKAALFVIENEEMWIPRSVISEVDNDAVWVRNWFYERNLSWLE